MAPEIINDEKYNYMVDYFNLGTLTFEMIVGKTPQFDAENHSFDDKRTLKRYKISSKLQDFICRLLEKDPAKRLGAKKGLKEILSHPWMRDMNMNVISKKRHMSPLQLDPYTIKMRYPKASYDISEVEVVEQQNLKSEQVLEDFSFYGLEDEPLIGLRNSPPIMTALTSDNANVTIRPCLIAKILTSDTLTGIKYSETPVRISDIRSSRISSKYDSCTNYTEALNEFGSQDGLIAQKLKKYI
eukprot:CAMPEP_0176421446 /NCGR_PEP_ID=MMETSP0127-20121128/9179_1 /TAXON_ID=938130 /ORGANISM="Platyophrya macrostoma, Strain WH" /LENGTH=241 /DNA_ID=CAMNT_0017802179 /DNA_START=285 /DNA_END=1011 /DNA_ORIENTATION=-